ncbi:hypothetical protein PoB_001399000 [Plakobranchus ocellatus]|uniref:Uncharacterized protein n=1 Tax=Plakobranchus ocellatus TaxID=259542 RepID=A0AAV3YW98_9GAST|nr:hypothetical protein PoB_001399000 [Plakobranchus ocellatus]
MAKSTPCSKTNLFETFEENYDSESEYSDPSDPDEDPKSEKTIKSDSESDEDAESRPRSIVQNLDLAFTRALVREKHKLDQDLQSLSNPFFRQKPLTTVISYLHTYPSLVEPPNGPTRFFISSDALHDTGFHFLNKILFSTGQRPMELPVFVKPLGKQLTQEYIEPEPFLPIGLNHGKRSSQKSVFD